MYYRKLSIALASAVVASGAWYAYQDSSVPSVGNELVHGTNPSSNVLQSSSPTPSTALHDATTATTASHAGLNHLNEEDPAEATRRALVVENDQFYTGSIVGNGPLQKATDDAGRKVLEMMTPEQATEKLRRNEESYLVHRGRGVVRYDVVQIPSNDPIEDDHAEKIVEVSSEVVPAKDASSSNDWMFWGVYDGHR